MDYDEAVQASRRTLFGDYRLRRQHDACARWPVGEVAKDHLGPVTSNAAILLISGELDPVTPPEWAETAAANLTNARHVVVPDSGHIFDGMTGVETCLDPLIVRFLETADANDLDVRCVAGMRPPPFVITGERAPSN